MPRVRAHHAQINSRWKICKGEHSLRLCPEFLKMTVAKRRNIVRKLKYCFNCLGFTHMVSACKSENTCFQCKGKHHSLLHFDNTPPGSVNPNVQSTQAAATSSSNTFQNSYRIENPGVQPTIPNDSSNLSHPTETHSVNAQAFFAKSQRTTL